MYDDKRRILLLTALSRTSPAGTIIAVLIAGAAAASMNYLAVCGADNARATEPEVALNDGLSEGPSPKWGSARSAMQRGLGNIPVLGLLPALVYDVLLPLGLVGSQMQGQEPSPCG